MIKAIETSYKGYKFRSRLEARWAVYFDTLGIQWQYEPEGFELPDGTKYLPDFHICEQGHYTHGVHTYGPWIEVKGAEPTEDEVLKLQNLCDALNSYGFMVWGLPGDENWLWIHKEGTVMEGSASTDCYCGNKFEDLIVNSPKHYDFDSAIDAAKSARFEFGQSGASL